VSESLRRESKVVRDGARGDATMCSTWSKQVII
jgi:hypothetical protein